MTQQIEPLKLQRRTNIEEHMQFFTKINEIVGAYKATVDLVDSLTPEIRNLLAALEGYRAEILNLKDFKDSASGSIATLNETVDLLKGKIGQCVKTVGQSTQQIEGSLHLNDGDFTADNVTALETIDADTLQAHALNVIDTAVVPDTANGSVSQYAVNAKRLMEEPSIVRTTGNQNIADAKYFTSNLGGKKLNAISVSTSERYGQERTWLCVDKDGNAVVTSFVTNETDRIENGFCFKLGNGNGVVLDCYIYVVANTETGSCSLNFFDTKGKITTLNQWTDERLIR